MDQHNPPSREPLILMVALDFFPSNEIGARRVTELARFLVTRGYRIAVVSSFGDHHVRASSEVLPGVTAVPVDRPPRILLDGMVALKRAITRRFYTKKQPPSKLESQKNAATAVEYKGLTGIFFRILYFVDRHKRWSWRASWTAIRAAREHGAALIISSGPPHSVLLAGAFAARRLRIPHLADLRDPWTDAVTANPHHRVDYLLQRFLENWMVRSSSRITSAGATVADLLAARYPDSAWKIHVVRNGYDGMSRAVEPSTNGKLSILFAGELYLGRNPYPFLAALERLLQHPEVDTGRVRVKFMGRAEEYDGRPLAEWLIGKHSSRIVTILPHGPAEAVHRAVSEATVLLNLAQQQPYSVPAKTYEHLVAGRENLVICENDSETARVVNGIHGVNQVDSRNATDLDRVLFDLYNRHVVQGMMTVPSEEEVRGFSRSAANERFLSIIKDVLRPEFSSTH